jgi:CDP-glycerol glycerophosphotransferase
MDALDAEISRWDHLISPSAAATVLLRSAFGYSGHVLETGYPRNDVLSSSEADERRAALRHELGIGPEVTAVLYAPTYRDDQVAQEAGTLGLDPEALVDRLGDDHLLLLRRHYYLGHQHPVVDTERVRDVSSHADIAELHLAADVLVTDYSSSLFDFAVTGKPIVLFAYDLEHYRDDLRGFTLDLDTDMPGPVVREPEALAEVLTDLPGLRSSWAERYAAFRQRFCHLEDGHASERVMDALWPLQVPQRLEAPTRA